MDWNIIIPALIVGLPIILASIANLIVVMRTKTAVVQLASSVDGHMTTLLEQTKTISKAEGKVEGMLQGVEVKDTAVVSSKSVKKKH